MDGNGRWAQRPLPSMMMAMCAGTAAGVEELKASPMG